MCTLFLRYGRRILVCVLVNDSPARVLMTSTAEVAAFKAAFKAPPSAAK